MPIQWFSAYFPRYQVRFLSDHMQGRRSTRSDGLFVAPGKT